MNEQTTVVPVQNKKNFPIIIPVIVGFVIVALVGFVTLTSAKGSTSMNQNTTPNTSGATTQSSDVNKTYTLADVAKHSSATDCWMVIEGNVYDVSKFVPIHPGGTQQIVAGCGKDATDLFNNRNGRGPHGERATLMLSDYLIGKLAS